MKCQFCTSINCNEDICLCTCHKVREPRIGWDDYFMNIARSVARRSNCSKRQIGAIVIVDKRVVSTGYNGTPRGVKNCFDGGCARCADTTIESGTRLDECWCCHAEENSIVQAAYHGTSIKGGIIYTTLSPCINCAKLIINAGITKVVYFGDYPQKGGELLSAAGITMEKPW